MAFAFKTTSPSRLQRRIASLGRVFELNRIGGQAMGGEEVAEYYELSFGAYRRRHSSEGSLHLALNDGGRFDPAGFSGQAARLLALWAGQAADVIELGFGHGYNLGVLTPRLPGTRSVGVNLTPGMWRMCRPCCASAASPTYRLAKATSRPCPGLTRASTTRTRSSLLLRTRSARRADRGMAMDNLPAADDLIAHALAVGFELERRTSLDAPVSPNVKRIERLVAVFVRWPWLARRMLARLNLIAMRNVLAGYLMGPATECGIWTYLELVLRKRG